MQETSWLPLRILSNASSRPSRTSAGRTKGGRGYATTPRDSASCLTSRGVTVSPLGRTRLAVGTAAISVGFSEQPASAPVRTAATPIANQELRMTPPRGAGVYHPFSYQSEIAARTRHDGSAFAGPAVRLGGRTWHWP